MDVEIMKTNDESLSYEQFTVKPVYNDHLGDKVSAVIMDRWSLITHDIEKNKSACISVRNERQCCDETTYCK